MDITDIFKMAEKKFGKKNKMPIVGNTGYWDKMKIDEGNYAFIDEHGREGVVVCIEIFEEDVLRGIGTVSLFRRYNEKQTLTRKDVVGVGFGQHQGPPHIYAMALEHESNKSHYPSVERWAELLEKGFLEVTHQYGGYPPESARFKYVLTAPKG